MRPDLLFVLAQLQEARHHGWDPGHDGRLAHQLEELVGLGLAARHEDRAGRYYTCTDEGQRHVMVPSC